MSPPVQEQTPPTNPPVHLTFSLCSLFKPPTGNAYPPSIEVNCMNHEEPKVSKLPPRKIQPATIAYSLAVHHKFDHLLYWMDAMYETQHFYMIHVDSKAPLEFWEEVQYFFLFFLMVR